MKRMKPAFLLLIVLMWVCPGTTWAADAVPAVPAEEVPEILTRGPVHEAFAQPVNLTHEEGLIAPFAPPPDITETPPSEKPTDSSVVWIPGYWAWDSDAGDYIWVSGCWRIPPPDRIWTPGYWAEVPGGWQWVSGFWQEKGAPSTLLPEPPPIDTPGPTEAAPFPDQIWVPPCWYMYDGAYAFRAGYWLTARSDWVWIPSCTIRTPRGYLFANGYWDYPLRRRGVLFAPARFSRHLYMRPGLLFGPSIVIHLGRLDFGLFARPLYRHYYFGDYYDRGYIRMGIFPRYECQRRHTWYDPLYMHDRWKNRHTHPRWMQYEKKAYTRIRDTASLRPPRVYREPHRGLKTPSSARHKPPGFAGPLSAMASEKNAPFRFEKISGPGHQRIVRETTAMHRRVHERARRESGKFNHQAPASPSPRIRTAPARPMPSSPEFVRPTRRPSDGAPMRQTREIRSRNRFQPSPAPLPQREKQPARQREPGLRNSPRQTGTPQREAVSPQQPQRETPTRKPAPPGDAGRNSERRLHPVPKSDRPPGASGFRRNQSPSSGHGGGWQRRHMDR